MDSGNIAIVSYIVAWALVGMTTSIKAARTSSIVEGMLVGFFAGMVWPGTIFVAILKWVQSFKIWNM